MLKKSLRRFLITTLLSIFILSAFVSLASAAKDSFVTGGGWITKNGENVNFGFNAKYKPNGSIQGEFTMVDRSTGKEVQYQSTSLNWLYVPNANLAFFTGKATVDREGSYYFAVHVWDNGTPGINSDAIYIWVSNGYRAYGKLEGGNIDIKL